ncbi:MAG TPA: hypothetical protein VFO10_07310 [Oligoflexus sp.]|uniref:hypothetical protein n=1 Tax=Oligoflexus sp. TaxID=1971216 RepID=UPI002D7F795E|nr:hypothetical protein [Oligoflexus sp.]HET9237040.1 hypothetical protein [Oligoflexus sp.]
MALRLKVSIAEGQKPNFRIPAYSENDPIWNTKKAAKRGYHGKAFREPLGTGGDWNTALHLSLEKTSSYHQEYAHQGKRPDLR